MRERAAVLTSRNVAPFAVLASVSLRLRAAWRSPSAALVGGDAVWLIGQEGCLRRGRSARDYGAAP
jgi:hypothetical protein